MRVPSHVKAKRTAAMVERSLLAAERSVWVAGVVVGGVVVRREVVWPVSWEVVVVVDIGTWNLLGEGVEDPDAKTADRRVAALAWRRPWMATLLEAYGGRLAVKATMGAACHREPESGVRKSRISERREPLNQRLKTVGNTRLHRIAIGKASGIGY